SLLRPPPTSTLFPYTSSSDLPLLYVQADTVVRWQRERFRKFWAHLSRMDRRRGGRPASAVEIRRLIERMVATNPLWRAPRLHGRSEEHTSELQSLAYLVCRLL